MGECEVPVHFKALWRECVGVCVRVRERDTQRGMLAYSAGTIAN